jgi:hypothetical protein
MHLSMWTQRQLCEPSDHPSADLLDVNRPAATTVALGAVTFFAALSIYANCMPLLSVNNNFACALLLAVASQDSQLMLVSSSFFCFLRLLKNCINEIGVGSAGETDALTCFAYKSFLVSLSRPFSNAAAQSWYMGVFFSVLTLNNAMKFLYSLCSSSVQMLNWFYPIGETMCCYTHISHVL